MTIEQAKALRAIARAIIDTVAETGTLGAPGGHLYAALMTQGCTFNQFDQIMTGLVRAEYLEKRGDCYYPGKKEL